MPVVCPQCGSPQVQSFQATYQAGTSTFSAQTPTGVAGKIVTSGEGSTTLAKITAPPARALTWRGFFGVLVLGWVALFIELVAKVNSAVGVITLLGSIALAIWVFVRGIRHNRMVHPGLVAAWQRMWICLACSHRFDIGAAQGRTQAS